MYKWLSILIFNHIVRGVGAKAECDRVGIMICDTDRRKNNKRFALLPMYLYVLCIVYACKSFLELKKRYWILYP